ncbi:MAG TPA: efflux RND transporter periplasmic adaptor subunit [Tenuifilaceae bacterium]|nr:efflux RND transporter periplasmic adaptor subunit [Tenuifilaceae bacterium]HPE16999.1 efflux RND transporter periplasmic adaptor subunit [Tenuifilaceae bacterium]HPJ44715.1 efflux RND transporter periplasmic adaptor subunit [Tenuifilaceae bacterium]HPQ32980.1 efflux RND transporter periplasmic adaptor subunit [Tenuifilaceae bacterium]HRX66798.1 efflux RND transporter periplasmic adaptor subunit [Tenuifilaceae bacterium]
MKKYLSILLVAMLAGCSSTESPEAIRAKISALKDQSLDINHQINELEKQLESMENDEQMSGYVPVKTETLTKQLFEHFIIVNGKVELVEEAMVSPEANGQITKIHVEKGQRVSKGDVLITLNTSIIENSIAELKLGLELATKIFEKQKGLWEQNIGSELQYLEAKNAKESLEHKLKTLNSQLEMSIVRAPFSGIVDDIYLKEGELASPGRAVLYLANLQKLKIVTDVSETLLPKIHVGDVVSVKFPTYNDIKLQAPIHRIGNLIDPKTRTIKVEILVDNIEGKIKPNQIAMLSIKDFEAKQALVVPSIVVKQDSRGEFLFVTDKNEEGNAIATKKYVTSGLSYFDRTMILDGISEGQKVIVAGYNQVGNGSLIEER